MIDCIFLLYLCIVGEIYWEYFGVVVGFGGVMIWGGVKVVFYVFLFNVCKMSGSDMVCCFYVVFVEKCVVIV